MMRTKWWLAAAFVAVGVTGELEARQAKAGDKALATKLLAEAIDAMGGEARLTSLHSLAFSTIGHGYALEQSERPEGPWLTTYTQETEIRDFDHQRLRLETQRRNWTSPDWSPAQTSIATPEAGAVNIGTRWIPTTPAKLDTALALDPERLLFTARAATDVRAMPDETQQKIAQHVVAFTYQNKPMRLLLNPWTHLPTMLEITQNDRIWGDVTERRWYSFWTLEHGGLMYPRQTTTEWNGFPHFDFTIQRLTVDGPVDDAKFAIPDDVKNGTRPTPPGVTVATPTVAVDDSKVIAVSDSIVEIPGGYNVSLVHQPDGLVVIEGTSVPDYSKQIMAYAAKRFPGVPIKALVTTSDAWPHIGGVREYVAQGVPIYPLDLNVSILNRIISAPHTLTPDTLATKPKAPIFRPVSQKTTLGAGDTRMELIPMRGEIGERMMLVWFPAQGLLYSSDSIQHLPGGKGFFMPSMLNEVKLALDREHITGVKEVFGMHLTPTPWADVLAAIEAAK